MLKGDFITFFLEFHSNRSLVKGSNSSFITLIPKVEENPVKLKEFRSISLIGCMYNVLAKLLANRLRKVVRNFRIPICVFGGASNRRWYPYSKWVGR